MVLICWLMVNIISDSYLLPGYRLLATSLLKSFVRFVLVPSASPDPQLFLLTRPQHKLSLWTGVEARK